MTAGEILGPGQGKVIALPGVTAVFKAVADRRPGDFVVLELTVDPGFAGPRPPCITGTRNSSTEDVPKSVEFRRRPSDH